MSTLFYSFMAQAITAAQQAQKLDEVPVGAVIVSDGYIIASGYNTVIMQCDPTAHAEINVIRAASIALGTPNLSNCDLYVTLEPCAMCAQAIAWARIKRLYFGAYDIKSGGVENGARIFSSISCHHRPQVYGGIMATECGNLVSEFFHSKRQEGITS